MGQAPRAASSSAQGAATAAASLLPALRAVKLVRVRLSASSLEVLQQVRQLTALEIEDCTLEQAGSSDGSESEPGEQSAAALSALLPCLPQLSKLGLQGMAMSDATLAPLSTLAHLESLRIPDNTGTFAADRLLLSLPSAAQLTALRLEPFYYQTMFPSQVRGGCIQGNARTHTLPWTVVLTCCASPCPECSAAWGRCASVASRCNLRG